MASGYTMRRPTVPIHALSLSVTLLIVANQAIAGPGGAPKPSDLREQGIHYLKMNKRELAKQTLEKALRLGAEDDERLILTLARLYREDGNVRRAMEVLDAGPETTKVLKIREQLHSMYARVRLRQRHGNPDRGFVAFVPLAPIINTEKKTAFARTLRESLRGVVELPVEVVVPAGKYWVNGQFLETKRDALTDVFVPFYQVTLLVDPEFSLRGKEARKTLSHRLGAWVKLVDLADKDRAAKGITETAIKEPHLIVTMGEEATRKAYKQLREIPLLATGISKMNGSRMIRQHGKATALWYDAPRRALFAKLKELYPKAKRIGLVFQQDVSWGEYQDGLDSMPEGMMLVAEPVDDPSTVSAKLFSMRAHMDALWLLPNPTLFPPKGIVAVSLWGMQEGIAVVSEDLQLVHSGVMLAAQRPWTEVVNQTVRMAREILWKEKDAGSVSPRSIQKASWGINTAVCKKLGVEVPESFLRDVTERSDYLPGEEPVAGKEHQDAGTPD